MAATSASDVWAVGYFTADPADGDVPLTLHWDGTAWHQVPAPSLTPPDTLGIQLTSVSATSPSDAWAVGSSDAQHSTIVMHWDGNSWTTVPSPSPGGSSPGQAVNTLNGVVALSAGNVIAVGDYSSGVPGSATHSMVLQRNGSSWSQVSHPDPGVEFNFLNAVSAGPAGPVSRLVPSPIRTDPAARTSSMCSAWFPT